MEGCGPLRYVCLHVGEPPAFEGQLLLLLGKLVEAPFHLLLTGPEAVLELVQFPT